MTVRLYTDDRFDDRFVVLMEPSMSTISTPTLTELLEMQIELWDTFGVISIKSKNQKVRETAYNTLVCPQLEYAAPIWDPYTKEKTLQLEKIKRRAARWTTSNYDYRSSVTSMLDQLSWRTLEQRRADARLFFSTKWSMELWQYPSQITSSPHIECPVTVTQ